MFVKDPSMIPEASRKGEDFPHELWPERIALSIHIYWSTHVFNNDYSIYLGVLGKDEIRQRWNAPSCPFLL